jgi:hypothetical protein
MVWWLKSAKKKWLLTLSDTEKIRHPEPQLTRDKHIPVKEYGLLKVWEWPDGTVIHLNTKKGEETMRIYHSSGSYEEYTGEGNRVSFGSNNHLQYTKGGVTVTFDNSVDQKGSGHTRLSIDHDSHIEVKKNASIAVAGTADVVSIGAVKVAATDIYIGSTKGSIVLNAARDIEMKAGSRIFGDAGASIQLTAKGDIHSESEADIVNVSGGDTKTTAQGNISENATGDIKNDAKGDIGITAGKAVTTYGPDGTKVQKGGPIMPKHTVL